jgi:hypothetical protein
MIFPVIVREARVITNPAEIKSMHNLRFISLPHVF